MNLSVNSLDLSAVSQETKDLYAFPQDKLADLALVQQGLPRSFQQDQIDFALENALKISGAAFFFGIGSACI